MNRFNLYYKIYDKFMEIFKFYKPDLIIKYLSPKTNETVLDLGGGTGYIADRISKKVKKNITKSEIIFLDNAGHFPIEENSQGFIKIIDDLLK